MRTMGLKEAAEFLRVHPEELRRRAKAGHIPGAKVGRAWGGERFQSYVLM